jgi:hypothetical protein
MATWIGGVQRPTGSLRVEVKALLERLGPVVAEHDGWHTATALALYHLAEAGVTDVLLVSRMPKWYFRLSSGWAVQEPGLISPICRCAKALWLGPLPNLGNNQAETAPEPKPPGSISSPNQTHRSTPSSTPKCCSTTNSAYASSSTISGSSSRAATTRAHDVRPSATMNTVCPYPPSIRHQSSRRPGMMGGNRPTHDYADARQHGRQRMA